MEQREVARRNKQQLASLRQVMRTVQHHLNNLATSLQLVELEYRRDRAPCAETLKALQQAVHDAGQVMNRLGRIDDPFDPAQRRAAGVSAPVNVASA
jgi:hypothetical protein